jgi:hypothetical protein
MRNGTHLAVIAEDRLGILRASPYYNAAKLRLIIGGQFGSPGTQTAINNYSSQHDEIALGPYFGWNINTHGNDYDLFCPLFARCFHDVDQGLMTQNVDRIVAGGRDVTPGIYEINFHTTSGSAPTDIRNDFVTSAAGAIALPLYMLAYLRAYGIRNQCAFTALAFCSRLSSGDYIRLWGMLRDLEGTGLKRPTWLGVELANRALLRNMITTTQTGHNPHWTQPPMNDLIGQVQVPFVNSFAFNDGERYSIILFNLDLDYPHEIQLNLPNESVWGATLYQIAPPNIHDNNEDAEDVRIETFPLADFESPYYMVLPPHSVSAVVFHAGTPPPVGISPPATACLFGILLTLSAVFVSRSGSLRRS